MTKQGSRAVMRPSMLASGARVRGFVAVGLLSCASLVLADRTEHAGSGACRTLSTPAKRHGCRGPTSLRLRGGASAGAKSGGLFAASITRWEHDDVMQV